MCWQRIQIGDNVGKYDDVACGDVSDYIDNVDNVDTDTDNIDYGKPVDYGDQVD